MNTDPRKTMLAALYHAHHAPYQEDLPFWLGLARQYAGRPSAAGCLSAAGPVLELGCGTGRVLLPLLRAGFRAVGLDRDREMLILLRQNYQAEFSLPAVEHPADFHPAAVQSAPVFQADLADFRLGEAFALILLPCNTLSSLADGTRGRLYDRVTAHLAPGGCFAFSIANPRLLLDLPRRSQAEVEEHFIHPLSGNPVQVSSAWRKARGRFILTWHYDHLLPDGQVERLSLETRHTLQPVEAYESEMAAAGLRVVETWGDFERGDFNGNALYWIALAERSG